MTKFTAIDLFAGIGGIKTGLTEAGFEVIFSNDNDPYCEITFKKNFPDDHFDNRDIEKIVNYHLEDIPEHDLLAAGFPCQPFSQAGLKKGFIDHRGSHFFALVNIIRAKQPKAFLLENVKNLKNHNQGKTLQVMLNLLRNELGYHVIEPQILNSKDFGLPQNRERIYIVGFKDSKSSGAFSYPESNIYKNDSKVINVLDKEPADDWYFLSQAYLEGLEKHKERHKAKKNGFGLEVLDLNGIANAVVVGNMGRERNLIQDVPRPHFYKEGMDKYKAKNNRGIRKLTINEYARLQGFDPEKFVFPVSRTQAYKQIGNSVAIPVIKAIAKNIHESLKRNYQVNENQFEINNFNSLSVQNN